MPATAPRAVAETALSFDLIDVLGGLFVLRQRSPTLEGSAPLKAVQFCPPFIQGNASGVHVWFGDSAVVQKTRDGFVLGLTEDGHTRSSERYAEKVERMAARGHLVRDGFWHRKLRRGFSWIEGKKLHVWTGHLVRPAPGVWLLLSGAYNRRAPIEVEERVIPDSGGFVPLVLSFDLASVESAKSTWLEKEVACLLPLRPDVSFTTAPLSEALEFGRSYCEYFDQKWDSSGPGNYVGAYRKLTAGEPSVEEPGPAACRLIVAGGPDIHEVRTFDRFLTADGWKRRIPGSDRLQYVVLHNLFDVSGRWDGHAIRDLVGESPRAVKRLETDWVRLLGEAAAKPLHTFLSLYARSTHGPRIGEPLFMFTAWAFISTPVGWSSVVDGCRLESVDGLRGVISTDRYHSIVGVFQFLRECSFAFRRGAPLMRVLPAPRRLLGSSFRETSLDAN